MVSVISNSVRTGRAITITVICLFIGFSFLNLVLYVFNISNAGYQKLVSQLADLIISLILSYFLYKGNKWARPVMGILILLTSLTYLVRIVEAFIVPVPFSFFTLFMIVAFVLNGISCILLFSRRVKSFIQFQQGKSG